MCLDKTFQVKNDASVPNTSDIAAAVWGYSNRSLTTLGTFVSDIWNYTTRTLTGAGLTSGSLVTKSDIVNVVTSNILMEQIVNRPVLENSVEEIQTINLQSKLNQTTTNAQQLLVKTRYLKSKIVLLTAKWQQMPKEKIGASLSTLTTVIGAGNDTDQKASLFSQMNWLRDAWGWHVVDDAHAQTILVQSRLVSLQTQLDTEGKSKTAYQEVQRLLSDINKLESLIGDISDTAKQNTLFGKMKETNQLASQLDLSSSHIDTFLSGWNATSETEKKHTIKTLSTEVEVLNHLPLVSPRVAVGKKSADPDKYLKNQILALKGMVVANVQLLVRKIGSAFSSTWLEEGSIVFKTLATNPSSIISQTVPIKYYLPKEVKKEHIVSTDEGLTVSYDVEKDQYYVSGKYTLAANESRTFSVVVDDGVFHILQEEIDSVRKQAAELVKPLRNAAYFAQGAVLKSDIDASLDKIVVLQKNGATPEAKIRAYRESRIEYDAAKQKLEKLKELATNAGSVGTLFGFVGGAQALAVWGLIIVMTIGFVFLTLYLRTISGNMDTFGLKAKQKRQTSNFLPEKEEKKNGHHMRFITILLLVAVGTALGGVIVSSRFHTKPAVTQESAPPPIAAKDASDGTSILGSQAGPPQNLTGEEVQLFVPSQATVSLHDKPTIASPVLTTLKVSVKALKLKQEQGWVNVAIASEGTAQKIVGWVDGDFIEIPRPPAGPSGQAPQQNVLAASTFPMITVSDAVDSFLTVRKAPAGEAIGKVLPGAKYPLWDSKRGWIQIVLDNGSLGWVSDAYVHVPQAPIGY